ncbi:hypothetical protein [Brevundimonas sp. Root1279]|nr:hypothetical protein [Brevundimonas sp. Root1279]
MSKSKNVTTLVYALSIIAVVASLSACRDPARKKLPVCPGDPRCEQLL